MKAMCLICKCSSVYVLQDAVGCCRGLGSKIVGAAMAAQVPPGVHRPLAVQREAAVPHVHQRVASAVR